MAALFPRGSHRLREYRTSPINGPTRAFVFEVCSADRDVHGYGNWSTVASLRLAVTEDPDRPGSLLVELAGPATVKLNGRWIAIGGKSMPAVSSRDRRRAARTSEPIANTWSAGLERDERGRWLAERRRS